MDVLKNLPDQPCTFLIDKTNYSVEIAYDNGKSKMVGYNGDDFPRVPTIEKSSKINVAGELISKAINKTLFATGNDDLRPVMSGVFCQFSPQDITFVATDAHKLVRYRRTDSKATGSSSFILPKNPKVLTENNSFYDAKQTYSLLLTCNTWINNGLKASGQKACLWTPDAGGIFYQYEK